MKRSADAAAALSPRLNLPYLSGAYLFAAAVRDLYLVVDGPNCVYETVELLCRRHDLSSEVISLCGGGTRIISTGVYPEGAAADAAPRLKRALGWLPRRGRRPRAVLVGAMPLCAVTGAPYEAILRRLGTAGGPPLYFLPHGSLTGDWLDGYDEAMCSLAGGVAPRRGPAKPRTVAIVGHLFHRGEPEELANVAEMRRLLGLCGIRLVCAWPSGTGVDALSRAAEASLIVSHPYGRKAAAVLAARTRRPLLTTGLPLGLEGSRAWLEKIAGHFGLQRRAAAVADKELGEAAPRLEWLAQYAFRNRRIAFAGDPYAALAFKEFCADLGAQLDSVFVCGRADRRLPELEKGLRLCEYAVPQARFGALLDAGRAPDLLIAAALRSLHPSGAVLEFGVPSLYRHSAAFQPYYGFRGAAALAERMAEKILGAELDKLRRAPRMAV